jgi:predicted amidohydrolase YtcJ
MSRIAAPADLILIHARITTLDPARPEAEALAVRDGLIVAVGEAREVMAHAGTDTRVIDAQGRRVVPGLHDSHTHLIRGGLNYNLELRWDGVRSLADAMAMLRAQVARTPAPQWVRVVGGFTEHQFVEQRLPTLAELNEAAPETPVFILHLYDRALLNRAALRAVGYGKDTPNPPGGEIQRDANGEPTGLLLAKPNALILYATLAAGPKLPYEYQINSSRHFMRELNRLGVTSVIDAGGGFQNYPDDYRIIEELAANNELTVRIAYNLFTQNKGGELADFQRWTGMVKPGQGDAMFKHNGAGEMLVFAAADFEDFREPRPELPAHLEGDLKAVVKHLAEHRWPFRIHATYDQSISRILSIYEDVNREVPFAGLPWFIDHAETISERNIERISALGGGIAIQHRMAYQGEYFVERYGAEAAKHTPPVKRMVEMGVPVGAGTDATRVASYNPWVALSWLSTGRTVGGLALYGDDNLLTREQALRLWTEGSAWFSSDVGRKGRLSAGQYADFAVLSADYMTVEDDRITDIESMLTVVGGNVVHGGGSFTSLAPTLPPPMPDWSPVAHYGGYQGATLHEAVGVFAKAHARTHAGGTFGHDHGHGAGCAVHGDQHAALRAPLPIDDERSFFGVLGCSCFAF